MVGGLTAAPAHASAADAAEAEGNLLSGQLLGVDTDIAAELARAYSANSTSPGADNTPLDVTALSALKVDLGNGVKVPLLGDDGVIGVGAAGQFAKTGEDPYSGYASSGLVGDDGAIAVGDSNDPANSAYIDLTNLLDAAGLSDATDNLVSDLRVDLGAIAASATEEKDGPASGAYKIADGKLTLNSPAVKDLAGTLNTTLGTSLGTVQTGLNGLIGESGALNTALSGVTGTVDTLLGQNSLLSLIAKVDNTSIGVSLDTSSLPTVLDDVLGKPITDSNGLVSLDLSKGTLTVDLAKIVNKNGGDLNGLPANTELLSSSTVNGILAGVKDAVNDLTTTVTGLVTDAVNGLKLNVNVDADAVNGLTGIKLGAIHLLVSGTLGQFSGVSGAGDPTLKDNGTNLAGLNVGGLVEALGTTLVGTIQRVVGPVLNNGTIGVNQLISGAFDGVLDPIVTTLQPVFDVLTQVASIKVNVQETPGAFETKGAVDKGSFTERAVQVSLLPGLGTDGAATVNLASATVRTQAEAPVLATIAADPTSGVAGDTITVTGENFTPNSTVAVTIDGKDAGTVATDENGSIKTGETVTVPDGIDPATVDLVGTDTEGLNASTDFTVEADEAGADVNANAAASAGASATADDDNNAAAQVAAQAAAQADASSAADAAASDDADAAAASAATTDASTDASSDATSEADASAAAAAQAAAEADNSDDTNAEGSSSKDANAAAAAQAAATSDSSTDASQDAAADADGADDPSGTDASAASADSDSDSDVNANAAASAGASATADDDNNAAAQAAAVAAAQADASSAADAAASDDANAAAASAATTDASTDASTDATSEANASAAAAAQAAAEADNSDDTNAEGSSSKDANAAAAAQAAAVTDASSDASKDAAADADVNANAAASAAASATADDDKNAAAQAAAVAAAQADASSAADAAASDDANAAAASAATTDASTDASTDATSEANASAATAAQAAAQADNGSNTNADQSAAADANAAAAAQAAATSDASSDASADAAADNNGNGNADAEPTITVKPNHGGAGDKVTVTGEHFAPNSTVTVTIDGKDAGAVKTDANGKIVDGSTVTVPAGIDPGTVDVVATDGEGVAKTEFTVEADSTAKGDHPEATVTYGKIVRGTGVTQTVIGTHFKAGEKVTATVHSTSIDLGTVTANKNGTVTWSFEVGSDFELGKHYVAATGAESGEVTGKYRTTDFVVVDDTATTGANGDQTASGSGDDGDGTSSGDVAGGSDLAHTGVEPAVLGIAGLALLLMVVGGTLVVVRTRRRRS